VIERSAERFDQGSCCGGPVVRAVDHPRPRPARVVSREQVPAICFPRPVASRLGALPHVLSSPACRLTGASAPLRYQRRKPRVYGASSPGWRRLVPPPGGCLLSSKLALAARRGPLCVPAACFVLSWPFPCSRRRAVDERYRRSRDAGLTCKRFDARKQYISKRGLYRD
jgi:hypothetical protein